MINIFEFILTVITFRIPGQLNDRRSMIGELNWIFTAVTDTIAWDILPQGMHSLVQTSQ